MLTDGGTAVVAALAACTINLRMLLYSASLAPFLARERLGRRMVIAYLLGRLKPTGATTTPPAAESGASTDALAGHPVKKGEEHEHRRKAA